MTIFHQKPLLGQQINWAHPLAKGLVGCWVMNENGGSRLFDLSGSGKHFDFYYESYWQVTQAGVSVRTDGVNDYLKASGTAIDSAKDLGIFAIIRTNTVPAFDRILQWRTGALGIQIGTHTDRLSIMSIDVTGSNYAGAADYILSTPAVAGGIYSVAANFLRAADRYTVDSVDVNGVALSDRGTYGAFGVGNDVNEIWLGCRNDQFGHADMNIVCLYLFTGLLTKSEKVELYHSPYAMFEQVPIWQYYTAAATTTTTAAPTTTTAAPTTTTAAPTTTTAPPPTYSGRIGRGIGRGIMR